MRYSQSNEDDIIKSIFGYSGEGKRTFVEFGCGKGNQNNTIALLYRGWTGLWCEPSQKRYRSACRIWKEYIDRGRLTIRRRVINPDKVNLIVKDPLDFLSIDIDGNDYAVWSAIKARPRVVCIEYDALNGTALQPICMLAASKGYSFATVSESKVNAFFLREDKP